MITKYSEIIKADESILVKRYGDIIVDKPIYQKVLEGEYEYYIIMSENRIVDDFFLNIKRNNMINLHVSLHKFRETVDTVLDYLSSKYSYITFTVYEDEHGKEKLDYLRNNYKIISDSLKLFDMTELVIRL